MKRISPNRSAILLALFLLPAITQAASRSQDETKKQEAPEPITWGVMGQTPGCVIFTESHKTSSHFYDVSSKNINKLTVIESEHYTLDQKQYLETQQNMDTLMQRAQKDHIKYVKIPEKYTPELLDKARNACKQDQ